MHAVEENVHCAECVLFLMDFRLIGVVLLLEDECGSSRLLPDCNWPAAGRTLLHDDGVHISWKWTATD